MDHAAEGFQSSPQRNSLNGSPGANGGSPLQYRVNNYMYSRGGSGQVNSDAACKGFSNTDLSPYNSKFTVLRFSQQKSTGSQNKGMASLRPFEISPEAIPQKDAQIMNSATYSMQDDDGSTCSAFTAGIQSLAAGASIGGKSGKSLLGSSNFEKIP